MQSPWEGELIRLRAIEPGDEPTFYRWMNDPEVTENLTWRYPLSHHYERGWIEKKSIGYHDGRFAVETLAEGELIGVTGLHDASPENRSAELGITVGAKERWDGGYGTDIMRVVCRFGFEMMNLHRIGLEVYAENARARHVYEKVGFKTEGCRRQAVYKNGRTIDVVFMGLIEGDLR